MVGLRQQLLRLRQHLRDQYLRLRSRRQHARLQSLGALGPQRLLLRTLQHLQSVGLRQLERLRYLRQRRRGYHLRLLQHLRHLLHLRQFSLHLRRLEHLRERRLQRLSGTPVPVHRPYIPAAHHPNPVRG